MMIIGVDEAGRGPLAGPVCAAAVMLHPSCPIAGLADSKQLSEKKRIQLAPEIMERCASYGVGWATVEEIDQLDILRATFMAMARAVEQCTQRLGLDDHAWSTLTVHVDGNRSPGAFTGPWSWPYATKTFVKGDQTQPAISAASILAKTERDAEMRRLDALYPEYGFAQHAGYGTVMHMTALNRLGPSPVHRQSFAPVARAKALMIAQGNVGTPGMARRPESART